MSTVDTATPLRPSSRIAVFDTKGFERQIFDEENKSFGHELVYFEPRLTEQTASLAHGFPVVCSFVNDRLDSTTLSLLKSEGVRLIALRSAGFNHVDLPAAEDLGFTVVRVPEYSPYAVAEHAVCLILALNRKIHKAYARVREANFTLDGLVGFDLNDKTIGIIGLGKIGRVLAKIMRGFGCRVLAYDLRPNQTLAAELGLEFVSLPEIYRESDIVSLHIPLVLETYHLINRESLGRMKPNTILINTGRGALIDTHALIDALKVGRIGGAGLDVYEEEEGIFFKDLSGQVLKDDTLARLLTFPNVLITSHQGFLTVEALRNIAHTTLKNISDWVNWSEGRPGAVLANEVKAAEHVRSATKKSA